MIFALPMIYLLRDVDTDSRYIGFVLLIWTFPASAVGLIIGPKVVHFYKRDGAVAVRGTRGGVVHVTGITGRTADSVDPLQQNFHTPQHSSTCRQSETSRFSSEKEQESLKPVREETKAQNAAGSSAAPIADEKKDEQRLQSG